MRSLLPAQKVSSLHPATLRHWEHTYFCLWSIMCTNGFLCTQHLVVSIALWLTLWCGWWSLPGRMHLLSHEQYLSLTAQSWMPLMPLSSQFLKWSPNQSQVHQGIFVTSTRLWVTFAMKPLVMAWLSEITLYYGKSWGFLLTSCRLLQLKALPLHQWISWLATTRVVTTSTAAMVNISCTTVSFVDSHPSSCKAWLEITISIFSAGVVLLVILLQFECVSIWNGCEGWRGEHPYF